MLRPEPSRLQPRKSPRQARSAVTVEAIHTATIQVLLADGASRLTTTRVAARAGVSVGTMYQYYPHKQALLFAVIEQKLTRTEHAMLSAADRLTGRDLHAVGHGLATAWLDAKTADPEASRAIYAVAADFDLSILITGGSRRLQDGVARLLASVPAVRFDDREGTAFMTVALLAGATRAVMELDSPARDLERLRRELPRACCAYLLAAQRVVSPTAERIAA